MEVAERSSSVDLSSVPGSDSETPAAFANISNNIPSSTPTQNPYLGRTTAGVRPDPAPAKKPRKPRPAKPKTDSDAAKPPRKPRASNGTTANSRKKPKLEVYDDKTTIQTVPPATGLQASRLVEPYQFTQNHPSSMNQSHEAAKPSQNGFSNNSSTMQPSHGSHQAPPQTMQTPPRAPMYDPIRGSIMNQDSATTNQPSQVNHTPPKPYPRSGASPISSLIDPPAPVIQVAPSPLRTFTTPSEPQQAQVQANERRSPTQVAASMMEVDGASEPASRKQSISKKASEPPTRAGSPKPARAKEQPPPLPTGKGLLSATVFGGELSLADTGAAAATGPNIVLQIDLKDPKNQVINFARLAEQKYGFAALYPRQAAQKERLARVAAVGAALERSASGSKFNSAGESGDDDGSVDIDRDSDNDGDVAMSGMNGNGEGNSGTDAEPKKRKRRKKVEEYDLDDDFVDDSEQVWEAQAATTKEGFFVYCGPLVPEGEKATIERADGTVKNPKSGTRGGRRGGGPGSRGGRGARATAAARDSNAASNAEERPKTGPGSRGGKVTNRRRAAAPKATPNEEQQPAQQAKSETSPPSMETKQQPVLLHA